MTYDEAVNWLFAAVPNFQRDGGSKNYKIGLEGPAALMEYLGNPGLTIPTIHIAGTNGKGSTAHMMAAGMQQAGMRVGLFSSPHLFSFRERAKIGRQLVPESFVANFVSTHHSYFNEHGYSFFELTFALAMAWFEKEEVDWIILETGMGGRLDATNICNPDLCIITNIGLDHKQWLGETRKAIAREKAGIIKPGVPVVIVERDSETEPVFNQIANHYGAPIIWAKHCSYTTDLKGQYQEMNLRGVSTALGLLFADYEPLWSMGLNRVGELTAFQGRWQQFGESPLKICDTGHNTEAFKFIVEQALRSTNGTIHWVLGAASDKDIDGFLNQLPKQRSQYYWTSTNSPRCLSGSELAKRAQTLRPGPFFKSVQEALAAAEVNANPEDLIFVGGSTFVVADLTLIP